MTKGRISSSETLAILNSGNKKLMPRIAIIGHGKTTEGRVQLVTASVNCASIMAPDTAFTSAKGETRSLFCCAGETKHAGKGHQDCKAPG